MMNKKKNPAAVAMAKKRWQGTTKAERKEYSLKMNMARYGSLETLDCGCSRKIYKGEVTEMRLCKTHTEI